MVQGFVNVFILEHDPLSFRGPDREVFRRAAGVESSFDGTIGWYDYSAADPAVDATVEQFAQNKRFYNVDAALIDWEWSDPEFADRVAKPFLETLDRLEADGSIRQTVVCTHVPVLAGQMCRKPLDPDWAFSNAYFGNLTLGEKILGHKKVTHIISGHTHIARQETLTLADGRRVWTHVLASEYGRPAWTHVET